MSYRFWGRSKEPELPTPSPSEQGADFSIDPFSVASLLAGSTSWIGTVAKVDRREAIQVPAVKRSRDIVAGTLGTLPLYRINAKNARDTIPLLEQPERGIPRSVTMTRTFEDVLFEAVAWWRIVETDRTGRPAKVVRLDPKTVSVQSGRVYVEGRHVPDRELIRFDSPNDALLDAGARAIRTCLKLDVAAAKYADEPMPQGYFEAAEGEAPSKPAIKAALEAWKSARQTGGTGFVPSGLKYNVAQFSPADLQLADARQHAVLEIARLAGVDPEDLGVSMTTRTYQNDSERWQALINGTLKAYLDAVLDRLSMEDVTPRGYRVRADLLSLVRGGEVERMDAYEKGLALGLYDLNEVQRREELPATNPPEEAVQSITSSNFSDDSNDSQRFTFDVETVDFKASAETRTVKGILVPYGVVGRNALGKFRFAPGSIEWTKSAVSKVKLNREHDRKALVGVARVIRDTPNGVLSEFKIARGPVGDQALSEAEDEVLDGLSAEVDILDYAADPDNEGAYLVTKARLTGAALTGNPAFTDARLTSVAASNTERTNPIVPDIIVEKDDKVDFSAITDAITQGFAGLKAETLPVIPAGAPLQVSEPTPYRFDRAGNFSASDCDFSTDLVSMLKAGDGEGRGTDAGKRVMGLLQTSQEFAIVGTDIDETNPTIQRPDMYVDQKDHRTPLWNLINKGAPPNGVQPFNFPKFNTSSGLVGNHTAGTEPTGGAFTTTGQTVTPTALSGKAEIHREVWDMGGNPAVSTLVFNQMARGYRENLETSAAVFLNTLTAAADLVVTTGATNGALAASLEGLLADLVFERGYNFEAFVAEKVLFKALSAAVDSSGDPLYPMLNPGNRNGTAASRFRTLDVAGYEVIPSWALASAAGAPNNSWVFDPTVVHGWATAPVRLELAGTNGTAAAPVAMVGLAIWGYKAFANSDIGGVRQVSYDSVV